MTGKSEEDVAKLQRRIAELEASLANQQKKPRVSSRGSGAVATRKSVAAGARGVAVGRDVLGGIYIQFVQKTYEKKEWKSKQEILIQYLEWVVRKSERLRLQAIDPGAAGMDKKPLGLASVYVNLNLDLRIPSKQSLKGFLKSGSKPREELAGAARNEWRQVPALEALASHRKLVLLGPAGSGKTTLSLYLALMLAEAGIGKSDSLKRLGKEWTYGPLLPVRVVLREFAAWLPEQGKARAGDLWLYIDHELERSALRPETGGVLQAVAGKQGALFLLDGLDEAGGEEQRKRVTEAVREFVKSCGDRCRFVITARPYAWEGSGIEELPVFERLAMFEPPQIETFIEGWYAALSSLGRIAARDAGEKASSLRAASRRADLQPLARNPLLLTLMATLHTDRGRLPDDRADLYKEVVELLLRRWNEAIEADRGLPLHFDRLQEVMEEVAFKAHAGHVGREGVANISETALMEAFLPHVAGDRGRAAQVVDYIEQRTGLLLGQGSRDKLRQFTFPHRTFQEYLAGCYLVHQTNFEERAAALAREDADHWREALVLAARRAGTERGGAAADALVYSSEPDEYRGRGREIDASDWRAAILAGEQLVELGPPATEAGQSRRGRVTAWLLALIWGNALPGRERVRAGEVLGRLGDPRFRADAWFLPDEPLLGFVEILREPFLMGTRQEDIAGLFKKFGGEKSWYEREVPQHRVDLTRYYVARFPVTVAQFQAFVKATGLERLELGDKDALRGLAHAPVVWVSWREALAYCEWLTKELRQWKGTPEPLASLLREEGWQVLLPSEPEWEKAARGTDGRTFPWEGEFDADRANTWETGIHAASSVGCFPNGASVHGVLDVIGNVWEWCRSKYERYPYQADDGREDLSGDAARVLRGGAFNYNERYARCAYRHFNHPDLRYDYIGFRVVVVPRLLNL